MGLGFYHPDRGYWETTTDTVSQAIRDAYPAGTVQCSTTKPGEYHEYDPATDTWAENATLRYDMKSANIRVARDIKLRKEVDPVVTNPLRWNDLTSDQQTAITTYRTALLDITTQSTFPESITWPTIPDTLEEYSVSHFNI